MEARPSNTYHAMDAFQSLVEPELEPGQKQEHEQEQKQEQDHEDVHRRRRQQRPGGKESFASIAPPGSFGPSMSETPPADSTFDPQQEYRKLLEVVSQGGGPSSGKKSGGGGSDLDAYQHLMSRERRVLDTVDRVVNDDVKRRAEERGASLWRMPVHELCMRTVSAVRGLFDDLIDAASARSLPEATAALTNPQRLPFLGVALVALALLLAAMQAL